jgi:hypothetical protein
MGIYQLNYTPEKRCTITSEFSLMKANKAGRKKKYKKKTVHIGAAQKREVGATKNANQKISFIK